MLAKIKEDSSSGEGYVRSSVDGTAGAVHLNGRAALGVEEDSDGEELAEATKKPSSPKAARNAPEFQTIEIEDMQITVQRRQRGRGFVVPLEGESLVNILGVLRSKVLSKDEPQREQRACANTTVRHPILLGPCGNTTVRHPICDGHVRTQLLATLFC